MVHVGSILDRVKPKTLKIDILNFAAWRIAIKLDSVKPITNVVDRWQLDSKTENVTSLCWPRYCNWENKMQ